MVIEHLKELDRIAYIRFASVYREFTDIESFRRELDALTHSQGKVPATQLPLIPGETLLSPAKRSHKATG
jgi:hypothetical protein